MKKENEIQTKTISRSVHNSSYNKTKSLLPLVKWSGKIRKVVIKYNASKIRYFIQKKWFHTFLRNKLCSDASIHWYYTTQWFIIKHDSENKILAHCPIVFLSYLLMTWTYFSNQIVYKNSNLKNLWTLSLRMTVIISNL